MGKHTSYTPELGAKVCEKLATGMSLRAICREDPSLPPESSIRHWVLLHDTFAAQYTRARDLGLDAMADELLDISDTTKEGVRVETGGKDGDKEVREDMLGHRRLQVDTRKWYLSKLAPKRYGDRLEVDAKVEGKLVVVSGVPSATDVEDLL